MPFDDDLTRQRKFYNRLYRWFLMLLVLVITGGVIIGVHQVFVVGHKIDSNVQRNTDYIKCIFLAKFDDPEAALPTATRQQVSDALDRCAKVQ